MNFRRGIEALGRDCLLISGFMPNTPSEFKGVFLRGMVRQAQGVFDVRVAESLSLWERGRLDGARRIAAEFGDLTLDPAQAFQVNQSGKQGEGLLFRRIEER